jgi:integrase
VVPLTVDQVRALVEVMPARMQAMVILQVSTGLRIAELLALRLSEIDFLRREVMIIEQLHSRTRERQRLKTPSSRRTVPLPQTAVDALAVHLVQFPANDEGYVFTNELGRSYQAHTYQYRIRTKATMIGLPSTTRHDLRHTYASWLLLAGESIATVAARLGHRNVAITLATYAHCVPTTEDRTRRAIDGLWSESGKNVASTEENGT